MNEETATTAELRQALAAALADLEWSRKNERAAAGVLEESLRALLADYEYALNGLRAARDRIAVLEADAAMLRGAIRSYVAARDAGARDALWQRMRELAEEVGE